MKFGKTKPVIKDPDKMIQSNTVNPVTGIKANATPSVTPQDTKIRDVINSYGGSTYGISDSMIGWDQNNQSVLINGESLMRADRVGSDNRAYAQEDMIKAAIDKYAQNKKLANTNKTESTSTKETLPTFNAPATPQAYASPYSAKIDTILNDLMSKEKFSYDPESDPVYQALKGQYSAAGDKALANTMAEASSLTGGRLNSWATSAGAQAKSGFDQQLMSQIPALADTAYNRYQGDINNRERLLDAIMNVDNTGYNRFSEQRNYDRGVLESDRNYGRGVLESDRRYNRDILESDRNYGFQQDQFKYQKETDKKNYDRAVFESDRGMKYQVTRDNILDDQWLKQFNAQERQRAVDNALQSRQISISEANAALNRAEFGYRKEQDAKEWAFKLEQAAKENKANVDVLGSQYSDMMSSKDPDKWLIENAPYMTKDELKALKALMPNDKNDVINQIMSQMDKK